MTPEELKQRLDAGDDLFVLDVRDAHEYQICNLGGHLIPLKDLPNRVGELDPAREVVVHCKLGGRSAKIIHGTGDVGRKKLDSAASMHCRPQSQCQRPSKFETRLTSANALEIFRDFDIIVDFFTDNFATRYLVNDACVLSRASPMFTARSSASKEQASVFAHQRWPLLSLQPVSRAAASHGRCSVVRRGRLCWEFCRWAGRGDPGDGDDQAHSRFRQNR
jgi:hypothetical protein